MVTTSKFKCIQLNVLHTANYPATACIRIWKDQERSGIQEREFSGKSCQCASSSQKSNKEGPKEAFISRGIYKYPQQFAVGNRKRVTQICACLSIEQKF